jgi:cytochrome c oxidase assembly protein subunit 15
MTAHARSAGETPSGPDGLDDRRRRHLRIWLYTGAVFTFVILIIGGATRLTQSGLSIVEWKPIVGIVPPLDDGTWQAEFDRYRQFPEYQKYRRDMPLAEFKYIYLWEYVHRAAARTIGVVFLVPFLYFWIRGYLDRSLLRRLLLLFALGALQGGMGWFMVKSGLVDDPRVSHYRLAAHLSIAFAIFGTCLWLAADLRRRRPQHAGRRPVPRGLMVLGALLILQIIWGAFVAGLDAGLQHNTFPLMGGGLVPSEGMNLTPFWVNPIENPATVQWIHRVLGTALLIAALTAYLRIGEGRPTSRSLAVAFLGLVLTQYVIGVFTLLSYVPVWLGVTHQAVAMCLFGLWLSWLHRVRNGQ